MLDGKPEWLIWTVVIVAAIVLMVFFFFVAMARFFKRPSPSEAIIRIGQTMTDVFIGRGTWIVPILHRAAIMSLSTIGLTIRRTGHEALISKDFISTNLCAEFYIRIEPNEEDVKKAARTIGIEAGHTTTDAIRARAGQLLEPKLVGALRAVAAQSDFLKLHLNREHFAQEVSEALREDLGRNGFTLESVTITELTQTPLSEMRADDIFGASGRETVTNTVVEKNIAVKRKVQEEAERTAEIQRQQEINVAIQNRELRTGKAREEEAAVKAELAKQEAIEARDLQRQAFIANERAKKEKSEQVAELDKQKTVEAALVDKEKTIEAAQVDKQITLTMKAKESAEADAQKAIALAALERANQEVISVTQVAEAERQKRVAVVAAERAAEQQKIAADVAAYQKRVESEALANAQKAAAEGQSDAVKIKAKAEADAAEMQAVSITKLAEAQREAGLKEAEVMREKIAAGNAKSREWMMFETADKLIEAAPAIMRELVKPAERIGEIKVLQVQGGFGAGANGNGHGDSAHTPLLGNALGPVAKTIVEASAVMPFVKELLKFADTDAIKAAVARVAPGLEKPLEALRGATPTPQVAAGSSPVVAPPPPPRPGVQARAKRDDA
jgi:flotillin